MSAMPARGNVDAVADAADAISRTEGVPIVVEEVGTEALHQWNAFVAAAPRAELYHAYEWRSVLESVFESHCYYLMARDDAGSVRGILPLARSNSRLFGDFLVSLSHLNYAGILADSELVRGALTNAAARLARELGVDHVELRHRAELELAWPARHDKVTMLLELPEAEDALWRSFPAKLRSQIRRPEKAGATWRVGGAELIHDFYSVFSRNMRDLGTPVYPARFFQVIAETFPERTRLCIVDLGGKPVAGAFLLEYRSTVEVPWASSLREANPLGVNMLLYWCALRDAVARGARSFDFGRSTKGSGTHRFKAQWGALAAQLRWHYWLRDGTPIPQLNPSNPKYRAAIALWKKLPVPIANVLGPKIVRYLA